MSVHIYTYKPIYIKQNKTKQETLLANFWPKHHINVCPNIISDWYPHLPPPTQYHTSYSNQLFSQIQREFPILCKVDE